MHLGLLRCKVAFSLLDSTIMCPREAISSFHNPVVVVGVHDQPLDLIVSETWLSNLTLICCYCLANTIITTMANLHHTHARSHKHGHKVINLLMPPHVTACVQYM